MRQALEQLFAETVALGKKLTGLLDRRWSLKGSLISKIKR